jgi:two-component system phosphate regulon sensor histidine kinase PhoR
VVGTTAGAVALLVGASYLLDCWYIGIVGGGVAIVLAGLTGFLTRQAVNTQFEREASRLLSLIDSSGDDGYLHSSSARSQLQFGLSDVHKRIEALITSSQRSVGELSARWREVELQARVAEADRKRMESILDTLTDAVIVTDSINDLALANRAAASILDFDQAPSRRRPVDQVVTDPSLVKQIKDMREVRDPSLRRHFEHRLLDNGREAIFNVTLSCLHQAGAHGEPSGETHAPDTSVVTILRDITREKEISRMKSEFVSSVSHELRTPLASIKAYIEMLVDGEAADEDTRAEFYSIIQGETNRLSRLIDNILNISRIESGIVKVHRERIGVLAIVREAVDIMHPQAQGKRIRLIDESSGFDCHVMMDRDMILQSLLNLLGNAIKYTPEGGQVRVGFERHEASRSLRVWVADTGVGIPGEDVPHLFEKFYRVGDHTNLAKGTGLGLNLVQHVIETVHGGEIKVESAVGQGSTFTFTLPIAED